MAIAVTFGNVGESMIFVWKGEGGFGEHGPFFGVECEFALVGAADGSFGADDVAGVGPGFEILLFLKVLRVCVCIFIFEVLQYCDNDK